MRGNVSEPVIAIRDACDAHSFEIIHSPESLASCRSICHPATLEHTFDVEGTQNDGVYVAHHFAWSLATSVGSGMDSRCWRSCLYAGSSVLHFLDQSSPSVSDYLHF